jgi:CO/xanthine dehydrogenase FAD-binding subunit
MRRLAFGHVAANVVRCAEFAAANLGHGVPHLRLEPDAGTVPVDIHIADHQ